MSPRSIYSALVCAWLLVGCGTDSPPPDPTDPPARLELALQDPAPKTLSVYGFFRSPMSAMVPVAGVLPYQVNAPLWADGAEKERFLALPPGATATIGDDEEADRWHFPEGTVIIKNFWFAMDRRRPETSTRLMETRLLVRDADGWVSHTYVWDEAQTEATRYVAGKRFNLDYTDLEGNASSQLYIVPNTNQCNHCHELDDVNHTLGLVTRQLQRTVTRDGVDVDQLNWLHAQGVVAEAPAPVDAPLVDPAGDAPLETRARSYLEGNCGHCHRSGGNGGTSGLILLARETHPATYGICKSPIAAGPGAGGRTADIVPGMPDSSIFIYRMESTDPEIKMPEIPNMVSDDFGVELISEWILSLTGDCR